MAPHALIAAAAALRRDIVFEGPGTANAVALTFDDGASAELTPALLEVLAAHGARATFFLIGSRASALPDVTRAIARAGHELGNHLWEDVPSARQSDAAFDRDLRRTADVLGPDVRLMRPASGWIGRHKVQLAARLGYRCVLGSIYPYDAHVALRPRIVADVVRRARPGSIIVLHEGEPSRSGVVAATDMLLTGLAAKGLATVTVSELLG